MRPHLRMFGDIGWIVDDTFTPVVSERRLGVLLLLAERRGSTVSANTLLDKMWETPPRSGVNAVQRHVSALRSELKTLGCSVDVIQSVPGGYRLNANVSTDLHQLESDLGAGAISQSQVPWFAEPLMGASPELHASLFRRLVHLSTLGMDSLVDQVRSNPSSVPIDLIDSALAADPTNVHLAGLKHDLAASRRPSSQHATLSTPAVDELREIVDLWLAGRAEHALDLIDRSEHLPPSLQRRFCRALIWADAEEAWARHSLAVILQDAAASPEQSERMIMALDASVLTRVPGGRDLVRAEQESASTPFERLRTLRVQYLLAMNEPSTDEPDRIIADIEEIDEPDARVESRRFRFLEHVRRGSYHDAARVLDDYERTVAVEWPRAGDDFAPMARAALQMSFDERAHHVFGSSTTALSAFSADRWLLTVASGIRRLLLNRAVEPLTDTEFHVTVQTMPTDAARAAQIVRDLHAGRPVASPAHDFAKSMPSMERVHMFLFAPVTMVLVAEALSDKTIAEACVAALEPWSGLTLGMWPIDFIFGPADAWLDRLQRI